MTNVLVTGASGFLGSAVVARLIGDGHNVTGVDPAPAKTGSYRHIRDDLSDSNKLADLLSAGRISHVLHCGGVSGPMVLADQPRRIVEINVTGSLNLLYASIDAGVQTYVQCSSVSAVGDFYESEPIGDDYPLRPTTTYGCSKAAVDMVLRGLWQRVPLDICSLRFTSIYGPGRQTEFIVDDIVRAAVRGDTYVAEATTDWPYVYIDDAGDAAIAACFSTKRRQLFYYIAYPQQVSVEQLAAEATAGGKRLGRISMSNNPRLSSRGPLDIAPAKRDFGFSPKVDYREGIRRMVADMLDRES